MEPTAPYELKNIDELKANAKNPRRISKEDFAALQASIKKFGDLSCVVFNVRTQQLVGGHQRIEAIKTMNPPARIIIGERHEPDSKGTVAEGTIYVENDTYKYREVDWDEGTEKAANVAANRIQGEFDLDLLAELNYELSQLENGAELLGLTGQTEEEISKLLDMVGANGESNPADDEAPEVDEVNPPVSKLGEIYQLGTHRLMCGDSTDFGAVSDLMNGQQAQLVHTDPPYGVAMSRSLVSGADNSIQNDNLEPEQLRQLINDAFVNAVAVAPNASMYWWIGFRAYTAMESIFEENGIKPTNCIVWVKPSIGLGVTGYRYRHELCVFAGTVEDKSQSDVWEFGRDSAGLHPTMKPVELVIHAIKNSSLRGNIVLDLFGGSGSTIIAADKTGRICYMMELDPKYCDVIRKRYAKHIGQEENWQAATPIVQAAPEESDATTTPTVTVDPTA